jgi:hypothetical protein
LKILALEKENPGTGGSQAESLLKEEAARVWDLYQAGILRELYFRQDKTQAVLILECESVEQAEERLNTLPLVQAGQISFEIIPLKAYPGFARLFEKKTAQG